MTRKNVVHIRRRLWRHVNAAISAFTYILGTALLSFTILGQAQAQAVCATTNTVYLNGLVHNPAETDFVTGGGGGHPFQDADLGNMVYALALTPTLVSDLALALASGCDVKVAYDTDVYSLISGSAEGSYIAQVRTRFRDPTLGTAATIDTLLDNQSFPPSFNGLTSYEVQITISELPWITAGNLLTVEANAVAFADAVLIGSINYASTRFNLIQAHVLGAPRLIYDL